MPRRLTRWGKLTTCGVRLALAHTECQRQPSPVGDGEVNAEEHLERPVREVDVDELDRGPSPHVLHRMVTTWQTSW